MDGCRSGEVEGRDVGRLPVTGGLSSPPDPLTPSLASPRVYPASSFYIREQPTCRTASCQRRAPRASSIPGSVRRAPPASGPISLWPRGLNHVNHVWPCALPRRISNTRVRHEEHKKQPGYYPESSGELHVSLPPAAQRARKKPTLRSGPSAFPSSLWIVSSRAASWRAVRGTTRRSRRRPASGRTV